MTTRRRIGIGVLFACLATIVGVAVEFYALLPLALGSDGDAKGAAGLVTVLILLTPLTAIPAFVIALYAARRMG